MIVSNYTVAIYGTMAQADMLARVINTIGTYDAVVKTAPRGLAMEWEVILPGTCVAGTEEYMRGFMDAYNYYDGCIA